MSLPKDMHIYGTTGYVFSDDAKTVRYRLSEKSEENVEKLPPRDAPFNDPFVFFTAAIRGDITVTDKDLSSLKITGLVL